MIVYQAHNTRTGAFYVGKTVKRLEHRKKQHFVDAGLARNRSVFHKAIRKYGADAFEWCVLHTGTCIEEINAAERHWITLIKAAGHRLYNLRPGGDGGSAPGKANHNFGRQLPESVKAKIAQGVADYYKTRPGSMAGVKGEAAPFYGKTHTEEARQKISKARRGQPRADIIGAANPASRGVLCITTGERFATATDAARKYDCDLSSVVKCCRGKAKSVKGRRFEYLEPGVFGWEVV